ncbi:MAG TPA: GNAT family N-acetyltransferase [Pseudonocardiaceae bacterium]
MTIIELDDDATAGLAYPAMKELRPGLVDLADFLDRVGRQRAEGYRLVGSTDADGNVVAAAGFRLAHSLAWGRHLYIDDLSTLPAARRKGHAHALLTWIDEQARELGCDQVHLDSGTHRHDAHRRYLTEGFDIHAFHFAKAAPAR